jgi:hypothetical protein
MDVIRNLRLLIKYNKREYHCDCNDCIFLTHEIFGVVCMYTSIIVKAKTCLMKAYGSDI